MNETRYLHGYSGREAARLADQAAILRPLLHDGIVFPAGSHVLEPGCGTGMQTAALRAGNPGIRLTCLDIDAAQLARARATLAPSDGIDFLQGDLLTAPLVASSVDHAFVCFLLEHLVQPAAALAVLRRVVRPGGLVVVVEGDHGSCRFHPEPPAARAVWESLPACQRRLGGDPNIGRCLRGLLSRAGFADIVVEPRMVYADAGHPALRDGFVRQIIVPMVEGAREAALGAGLIDHVTWDRGIAEAPASLAHEVRIVEALGLMIRRHAEHRGGVQRVRGGRGVAARVRDVLADRSSETVTLAQLEALTGAGRYRLIRAFRAAYGLPPHAWQVQIRLVKARALIRSGVAIAAAALEAGFADQAHLTRWFKRSYGHNPGALLRGRQPRGPAARRAD